MVFEDKTQLKKDLYDLSFNDKQKAINYLLELIKEDYEDLKDYN